MNSLRLFMLTSFFIFAVPVYANDFPTQARVEFVLDCMSEHGGQSYDTLYPCVCQVDKVAAGMPHERFEFAKTMSVMILTPGERGGAFRDAPGARDLVREYKALLESSRKSCFISSAPAQASK